jgi:PEP-CTERM motif
MKTTTVAAALAAALATSSVASATTFDLSYTGADFSLTATLDTTPLGGGEYLVTGLVGTVTDFGIPEAITLLSGGPGVFSSPSGEFQLNNVLHSPPAPTYFDYYGLGFTASGYEWNLCADNVSGCPNVYTLFRYNTSSGLVTDSGSAIVSEIPEPATWVMLALGFVGLGLVGSRKARSAAPVA